MPSASAASALLNVLIYSGAGTCDFSVKQTLRTLKKFLNKSYDVKLVSSDILRNEMIPWEENCALFVVPGGRDLHYLRDFNPKIIKRIKEKVDGGRMSYLGICAGAYFATDRIEFAKGNSSYEIVQDRPLKLIKCKAIGPIGKFFYSDDPKASEADIEESLRAVSVKVDSDEFKMAYNGGCYFDESVDKENIIATYSSNGHPAIIKTQNVCLSGIHLEYDAVDCLKEKIGVFSELLKYEKQRKRLMKSILKDLGLIVNETSENEIIDEVEVYTNIPNMDKDNDNVLISNLKIFSKLSDSNQSEYKNIPNLLFSRVTTSTQTILQSAPNLLDALPNFSIYVADHQINGKGRSDNFWISSPSCLQFTLKVENLFERASQLPLIQFLMALSVTEAINSLKREDGTVAKIKWPNDVYLCRGSECIGKVSGILVNCIQSHCKKVFHVLVGVGINLLSDPSLPNIVHLNDHLSVKVEKEQFLMELLERFKHYYENLDEFPFDNYHSNWLHTGQIIQSRDFPGKSLKIKGIDQFGYLIAEEVETQRVFKFEPDGNSFDMMKNLIHRK